MPRSKLEAELETQIRGSGLACDREVAFCPWRRWRADFKVWDPRAFWIRAEATKYILVEVQGIGPQGRHGSWGHHESDCEKFSTAAALGWRVLPVTGKQVRSGLALRLIEAALGIRPLEPPPLKAPLRRSCAAKRPPRRAGARALPKRVRAGLGLP